jgi:NAD(P)-dependent dehydrogenase (short-subunit alcohol dehydrogenase family)
MDIKESVVLVTGGASGLGEACTRELVKAGAKVSILDFADDQGKAVASELGAEALFCRTDVTDEKSVQDAVDKTVQTFGALHVAVNCAGVGTPAKVIGKEGLMGMDHFNRVVAINLTGTMHVIRSAAEKMLENSPNEDGEKGVVINVASIAAFEGQIGQAAYSASKAGVVGMTLPIAREFAEYGIRVLTIAPGIFGTPMLLGLPQNVQDSLAKMVPFPKRLGKPVEFAALVQHIIENAMLNGEVIRLDGALRMAAK